MYFNERKLGVYIVYYWCLANIFKSSVRLEILGDYIAFSI